MYKAVIMAGGKGTRLSAVTGGEIPKPMVQICGKPLLERQIECLVKGGVNEIVIITGYLGNKIKEYFGGGERHGVKISYIEEKEPLGSAGALYYLKGEKEDFFLVFGDTVFDIDLKRMMDFHKEKGGSATLFAHPNSHPYDSDIIVKNEDNRVIEILPKNALRDFYYENLVNAAFFVLSPRILEGLTGEKTDMEKGLLRNRIKDNKDVYAYVSSEYIKDAGTESRYIAVERDIVNGVVEARSFRNRQRCVFLDRDGTINKLNGLITSAEMLELLPGAAEGIKKINESGMLAVVLTNQPVIARGLCTVERLREIHNKLQTELGKQGAYIDGLFYCPHHPDSGYEGEVKELKIDCDCRKPKTGMFKQAEKRYNIDLSMSYTIGDSWRDIEAGQLAGTKTVLVEGDKGKEVEADYSCTDLLEAVEWVLEDIKK